MNRFARDTNRKTKAKEKLNIYEIRFCSFRSLFGLFAFRSTLSNRFRYSMVFTACIRSQLAKPPCAAVAATLKRDADKPQRSRRWRKHKNDTDTTFNHFRHNVFIWSCVEFASLKWQVAARGDDGIDDDEGERQRCVCVCLCTGENYCVLI